MTSVFAVLAMKRIIGADAKIQISIVHTSQIQQMPSVRNIVFRNISCTGKFVNPSLFEGYDKDRKVEDILFENIVLNGKRVTSPDELNINKREFVDKMHIK